MKIYYLILAWTLIWLLLYRPTWSIEAEVLGEKQRVLKRQHVFTSLVFILLFIGLRGGIMDSGAYIRHFQRLPTSFADFSTYFELHPDNKTFYTLSAIFKILISDQYYWWFFTITLISCLCMCATLRRYSENYGVSMYLFVASTMFTWLMNGLRQFLVVCILFWLFDWLVQKKFIRLLIVIWLLSTFHQSVLILVPIIFIVHAKPFDKTMWLILLLAFATLFATDTFSDILYEITMNTEYAEDLTYIEQDAGMNIMRALIAAVPVVLSLIKRKQIAEMPHPKYIDICINFSVIAFGLYLFSSVTSGTYIGRLPIYCEIYNLLLFPWLITVPYKSERRLYTVLLFVFYLLFFIYQLQIVWNLPYYSPIFGVI